MSSNNNDPQKVELEIIFTVIAAIVGIVALIGLIYVLCLIRYRHIQHRQQQQTSQIQQQRIKSTKVNQHRSLSRSSNRAKSPSFAPQGKVRQPYALSTPQPDDTYSIDSSGTMIELHRGGISHSTSNNHHNTITGLRSVDSNFSYMADMFSLTSDMIDQSSPTSSSITSPLQLPNYYNNKTIAHQSPQRPLSSSINNSHHQNEAAFMTNFARVPTTSSSSAAAIILNKHNNNNINNDDTSTAGDNDDFDEVWSYVATDVDVGGDHGNNYYGNDDIQSVVPNDGYDSITHDSVSIVMTATTNPDGNMDKDDDNDHSSSETKPKFAGRSLDGDRNMFEV